MVVLAALLGMIFFGAMGITMVYLTANIISGSNEDLQSSQAFYVGEGGLQYVMMNQLGGDTDFSDNVSPTDPPFGANSISLSPGEFWVEYQNQQTNSVKVKITSRVGSAVRVIEQQAGQGGVSRQYVTLASGNLNANSSSGNIYGDVGLRGNVNMSDQVTVHGNIYQDPAIELPALDFDVYEDMCTSVYQGSKVFSSNYTGNLCVTGSVVFYSNVTYTGLLYVEGNVHIQGSNVVINGSLITEGNLNADHQSGLQFNAQVVNGQHMPAIATNGNLSIKNSDGMRVTGVIWNDGNIDLSNSDNLQYTGSFMAGGNILINSASNLTLTFDADLLVGVPGLSNMGGGQSGSLSLSGWKTYAPWW